MTTDSTKAGSYGATTTDTVGADVPSVSVTWAGEVDPEAPSVARDGTIISSACNLSACALGASMLSLPYAMMIGGPLITLDLLTVFAVMAFVAGQAVINAGIRARKSSYSEIVRDAYGPTLGAFADALLSVALLVAGVSYICGLSDLIPKLLPFTEAVSRNTRIIVVLAILFPVTLISSLAVFGPVSVVATIGCYIQVVAVVMELFIHTDEKDVWNFPPASTLFGFSLPGLVYVSPMVCFVFAYHFVLTETLDELSNPTHERMTQVNGLAIAILYCCYLPISIAGYLNYSGKDVPSNMLTKLNENSAAVVIARLVIAGLLFGTYSLFIIPLRRRVEKAALNRLTSSMVDLDRVKVAAVLALVVTVLSVGLPDLSLANSLAGGAIAIVMFVLPGAMILHGQLGPYASAPVDKPRVVAGASFVVVGVIVAIVGLFGSILFDY